MTSYRWQSPDTQIPLSTYIHGFTLKISTDISKQDFVLLCDKVSREFSETFNEEYEFAAEGILEGGIQMIKFPGSDKLIKQPRGDLLRPYKSMRFFFHGQKKWPWIPLTWKNDWKNSDEILFEKGTKHSCFLKALYGAPTWTLEELEILANCFKDYDCKITRMPKAKDLSRELV